MYTIVLPSGINENVKDVDFTTDCHVLKQRLKDRKYPHWMLAKAEAYVRDLERGCFIAREEKD